MSALDQLELIKLGDLCQNRHLVALDDHATVGDAFEAMKKNGVTSVAIINKAKNQVEGIADIRMLMFFLAWGKYKYSTDSPTPIFDEKLNYPKTRLIDTLETQREGNNVWIFNHKDPVQKAMEPFAKGVHRALVTDGHVNKMLTQTDIVRWISTNHAFAKILDSSLEKLGLAVTKVISINENDSVLEGFRRAGRGEINAVAVVSSKNERLVANLSATDLKGIEVSNIRDVEQPVLKFLAQHNPQSLNPVIVYKGDDLRLCVNKMLSLHLHRVWVVDSELRPVGVVSMSDVIAKFTAYSPEMQP